MDRSREPGRTFTWSGIAAFVLGALPITPLTHAADGRYVAFESALGRARVELSLSPDAWKRLMDLAVIGVALVVLVPLAALIAFAVRLDSPGPVLYRQTRIGRRGRAFRMLKFRTMSVDADDRRDELRDRNEAIGGLFKIENDPRLTRVGRILRRYSLDELPQLANVLRGEMSLVGARPLIPEEDCLIGGGRRQRLALRPGMTGEWQLQEPARVPLAEMIEIDCLYVRTWSVRTDIKLLCRTVPFVSLGRGV